MALINGLHIVGASRLAQDCGINKRRCPNCRDSRRIESEKKFLLRASSDDDAPPEIQGDWRAFRAGLISKSGKNKKHQ